MGVDYTGHGSLYAMGSGTITSVRNSGWPGGAFIGLHLDSGQYMYYAENIIPHVSIGQRVRAGELVGTAVGTSPFIEVGWAAPPGTGETMAARSGQAASGSDPGAHPTGYGVSMNNLIKSLGGPSGSVSGSITGGVPSGFQSGIPGGNASTTSAGLPGCVPLIYYVWVMSNALRQAKERRRNVASSQQRYRRRKNGKRNGG
jgi:hypothetical protein